MVSLLKRSSDELNLLDAPLASFSGAELDVFDVFHLCLAFFERAGSFLFCQNPNTDIKLSRAINHLPREEVLGPLEAEVFIGLSEEEQGKRHIANVEAPSDKDVDSFTK